MGKDPDDGSDGNMPRWASDEIERKIRLQRDAAEAGKTVEQLERDRRDKDERDRERMKRER
jgi:hypothetical protein